MSSVLKQTSTQTEDTPYSSRFATRFLTLSGISLKPSYYQHILLERPELGFFEIHAENYLSKGGPARYYLQQIRQHYPLTVHGVGLSIGGESPINNDHLERVAQLVNEVQPQVFSEHLAWSSHDNSFLNDLLPVAYDQTTLSRVCEHIDQIQSRLKRTILIENPSTYFEFNRSEMSEITFLTEMSKRTGCGLLLDVNNVEVSCFNHQQNPYDYLNAFPVNQVGQIHLAGHTTDDNAVVPLKVDSHDEPVSADVWSLYQHTLTLTGDCPTLIERDGNIPPLAELLAEADKANGIRQSINQLESRRELII
ncbi:MNIO family bufferin maturase [Psychromonas sp. PT13]|uniref:MNIO family bufferin maturase n=1 Tax=Psychromonas sp. PT13 TaxID=3439547 RepID=UPI003EB8208D